MAKIIGIDLGTTNSVAAVVRGGESVVIPTAEGGPICPSVVAFNKNGEVLVGQVAKRQAIVNPEIKDPGVLRVSRGEPAKRKRHS